MPAENLKVILVVIKSRIESIINEIPEDRPDQRAHEIDNLLKLINSLIAACDKATQGIDKSQ